MCIFYLSQTEYAVTPDQTMNPQHMHQNYQMLFRFF